MGEEAEVLPEVTEQPGLDIKESEAKESVFSEDPGITEEKTETEVKAEEKTERIVFDGEQQKILDNIAAKGTKRFRDQERISQDLQRENDDLRSKMPVSARPVIPDLPDQFADDYADKMKARDEAMVAQTTFDANERAESQRTLQDQQTQYQQTVLDHQNNQRTYLETAEKLNIDKNELLQANTSLINMGLPMDAQNRLLTLPNGPQIAMFLAKNPLEASNLAAMSPMDAAVAMATNLTQKATEMFKPTDFPPDPTETLKGGGATEGDPYAIKGVKVTFS